MLFVKLNVLSAVRLDGECRVGERNVKVVSGERNVKVESRERYV